MINHPPAPRPRKISIANAADAEVIIFQKLCVWWGGLSVIRTWIKILPRDVRSRRAALQLNPASRELTISHGTYVCLYSLKMVTRLVIMGTIIKPCNLTTIFTRWRRNSWDVVRCRKSVSARLRASDNWSRPRKHLGDCFVHVNGQGRERENMPESNRHATVLKGGFTFSILSRGIGNWHCRAEITAR